LETSEALEKQENVVALHNFCRAIWWLEKWC